MSCFIQFPPVGQERWWRLGEENKIARGNLKEQEQLMVHLADALALLDRKVNEIHMLVLCLEIL